MLFSVLMSLYKNDDPAYLDQCLNSLLMQTVKTDELIIVFDGPIGNDLSQIVSKYSNNLPISIVELKENVGLGNALNEGLKSVTNEWVFRMDSDDICRVDRFELQISFISLNPEIDVVGGYISEFDSDPNIVKSIRKVPEINNDIYKGFSNGSPFNHVTVAFKKSVVQKAGGYKGGRNFQEDMFLWFRLAENHCLFANIPKVLVDVRVGNDMISRRRGLDYFIKEFKVSYYGFCIGVLPVHRFVLNSAFKFILRLSPNAFIKFAYNLKRKL